MTKSGLGSVAQCNPCLVLRPRRRARANRDGDFSGHPVRISAGGSRGGDDGTTRCEYRFPTGRKFAQEFFMFFLPVGNSLPILLDR